MHIGIPSCFSTFAAVIAERPGSSALVSANAFWRPHCGQFRVIRPDLFHSLPTCLDSAGFVAMFKYGGYRWPLADYIALAKSHPWLWWAAPDFCCEPEIAADRQEVRRRVERTADNLNLTIAMANDMGAHPCMPVLQGWRPDDYLHCADRIAKFLPNLPPLVGLGSMCRRHMNGPTGALAIIDRLDATLPDNVQFHLFGVKGPVAIELRGHRRVASGDSCAWDAAARREATKRRKGEPGFSCSTDFRSGHLRRWRDMVASQLAAPAPPRPPTQLQFFMPEAA